MKSRRLSIRRVCRSAAVDPSFLAKVLRGERRPPDDERVLRRLADALQVEPHRLMLAAGLLPAAWRDQLDGAGRLEALERIFDARSASGEARPIGGGRPAPARPVERAPARPPDRLPARAPEPAHRPREAALPPAPVRSHDLSEDLL
jgi:transcriptional regulator with XRE-family HTH domain